MLMDVGLLVVGLIALFLGGNWLVEGASRVAIKYGIPTLIIGLTIVAIGTSAPELFVSVQAAFDGVPGIALGNVVGSNIANVGLILGLSGMVMPIAVKASLVRREIPIMILVTLFATLLILDGNISRLDGIILLGSFVIFNLGFYLRARQSQAEEPAEVDTSIPPDKIHVGRELGRIAVGIVVLVVGSELLVNGASSIARALNVPELIIGVTMVALGTSLPELATSLSAAFKGESDIALGNVIGSNVANLLLVLGATATVLPIEIQEGLSAVEFGVMIGFSLVLIPMARNRVLARWESAGLFAAYLIFIAYSFLSENPQIF